MSENEFWLFSGGSNRPLAEKIAQKLNVKLGNVDLKRFSDGEIWVKYHENIRGKDLFILQTTNSPAENLMELLIMIDAARRASAKRITAVIPYFGYARQDRKDQPRVSITAKLIANLITVAKADRVLTMDLHAPQIQGFFDIPFDHLYAAPIFAELLKERENLLVATPDVGGIKMARSFSKRLGVDLVVIDKRRPEPNIAEVMNIIGSVEGKNVLLVDDMIDTGGTFVAAVNALKERGALKVYGTVTHALLSGSSIEKINNSKLDKLYVTDTLNPGNRDCSDKIEVRSVADLFANAIFSIHNNESISKLFV